MAANGEAQVRALAQSLWEQAGRPEGRDVEFWLAAEAQVKAAARPRTGKAAPAKAAPAKAASAKAAPKAKKAAKG